MRVALVYPQSTHGFDLYTFALGNALAELPDTEVAYFSLESGRQSTDYYCALGNELNAPEIDVIHLPHEHSFYGGILPKETGFWELRYLLKKPIVLTAYNIAPMEKLLTEVNLTQLQRFRNGFLLRNRAIRDAIEIAPFATSYTIVSTNHERKILIERGAKPEYVTVIPDGIPEPTTLLWSERPEEAQEIYCLEQFDWRNRPGLASMLAIGYPLLAPDTHIIREIWNRMDCIERFDPQVKGDFRRKYRELKANKERQVGLSVQACRYAKRYSFSRIAVLTRRAYVAAISVF